jgi:hypothetical protein
MKSSSAFLLTAALTTTTVLAADPQRPLPVNRIAEPAVRPVGAPRYSDVSFSSRGRRDGEPHDTFRSAAAFHATRLDWVYNLDAEWIALCRGKGYAFNGTLSSATVDGSTPEERERGRIRDRNGELVTAPWMRKFPRIPWWGCVNSPAFQDAYRRQARIMIDAGVDSIQMDDPGCNYAAVAWGACWCAHCREKAAAQGADLETGMKRFQRDSVSNFYQQMHAELRAYAGRPLSFSANNYDGRSLGVFPHDPFDFGIAELPLKSANPGAMATRFLDARRLNKAQIFTLVSDNEPLTRRVIATAYANGGHLVVPWDVYFGANPRIYATPDQYADLYAFVRGIAPWLDGYEDGVVPHTRPQPDHEAGLPVRFRHGSGLIQATVRAKPGEADAPVAVHLVEWGEAATFTLSIDPLRFFGARPVRYRLLMPQPYDAALHRDAAESRDYAPLVRTVELARGRIDTVRIPALHPWGVLLVDPLAESADGLYAPTLVPYGGDFVQRQRVRLYSADEEAVIHYSLDGADPTPASPRYTAPFLIGETTLIKARAFKDGVESPVAAAAFTNAVGLAPLLVARDQLNPGLRYAYYENARVTEEIPRQSGSWTNLPDFAALHPRDTGVTSRLTTEHSRREFDYAYVFEGLLDVPADGFYVFASHSDDGVRIRVNGVDVLVHDKVGLHYAEGEVALQAGLQPLRIEYFEAWGDERFHITWKPRGGAFSELPAERLFHQRTE